MSGFKLLSTGALAGKIQTFSPKTFDSTIPPSATNETNGTLLSSGNPDLLSQRSAPRIAKIEEVLTKRSLGGDRPQTSAARLGNRRTVSNGGRDDSGVYGEARLGAAHKRHETAVNSLRNRVVGEAKLPFQRKVTAGANKSTPKSTPALPSLPVAKSTDSISTSRLVSHRESGKLDVTDSVPFRLATVPCHFEGCVGFV
jgi:hypothetical protein